jgi:hypothetical protein
MVSLKVLVIFFFAHIINCCFLVWVVKDASDNSIIVLSIKILVAYNIVIFFAYGVVFILLSVLNARREANVLIVDNLSTQSASSPPSLDIEEEK